ncbi:MAG TPA: hypothetical protein VM847_10865 [Tahibacter sp.]|nr:hypothetical protein [Tahibacter sp.]
MRDALVARGVAAARIVVSGEGAAEPVASNDDAQGRARGRSLRRWRTSPCPVRR